MFSWLLKFLGYCSLCPYLKYSFLSIGVLLTMVKKVTYSEHADELLFKA